MTERTTWGKVRYITRPSTYSVPPSNLLFNVMITDPNLLRVSLKYIISSLHYHMMKKTPVKTKVCWSGAAVSRSRLQPKVSCNTEPSTYRARLTVNTKGPHKSPKA